MRKFVVDIETYIYIDAEDEEAANDKVLDIMNTAYNQGNEEAWFPNIDITVVEVEEEAWKSN
jgi:hypothetical protein